MTILRASSGDASSEFLKNARFPQSLDPQRADPPGRTRGLHTFIKAYLGSLFNPTYLIHKIKSDR